VKRKEGKKRVGLREARERERERERKRRRKTKSPEDDQNTNQTNSKIYANPSSLHFEGAPWREFRRLTGKS
jgi:hypothetical protein